MSLDLLGLCFALLGPLQDFPGAPRLVELQLQGPLELVELVSPRGDSTRVELALAAGESRRLTVPIAGVSLRDEIELSFTTDAGGRATLLEILPPSDRDPAWLALDPALRSRPRPFVAEGRQGPKWVELCFALAACLSVLALRSRRHGSSLVGLLGASTLLALHALVGDRRQESIQVVESLQGEVPWLRVSAVCGETWLEGEVGLLWDVDPAGRRQRWTVDAVTDPTRPRWLGKAVGARFLHWEIFDPKPRSLSAELNQWSPLRQVWLRASDGDWFQADDWMVGEPLPSLRPSPGPPGWINPALPQGVSILIGEEHPDPPAHGLGLESWLRLTGFEFRKPTGD